MNTSEVKKTNLLGSKKGVALILGLIQLNIILFTSVFTKIDSEGYIQTLTLFLSFYLSAETTLDVTRALKEGKNTAAKKK